MRKQLHYVSLFLLFFATNTLFAENHVDQYINSYKDIAIREMVRSGIPASITLAQGIHESAWGRGTLALNSNNHFGIKCKDYWKGSSYYHKDDDYDKNGKLMKSCFRAYDNPEKSYVDHTDFLMSTAHYQVLFGYSNTDYSRWAKGLKKCGYATDKEYANKLIRTIEKYQLYKYDAPQEPQYLASAPRYNISKQDINDLLIKAEKKEEAQIQVQTQFSLANMPQAVPIPNDYRRKPVENEPPVFEAYEMPKTYQMQEAIVEEKGPMQAEQIKFENKVPNNYKTQTFTPIKTTIIKGNKNEESIILSAFASTKTAHQLTRKPRVASASLR